MDNSTPYFLEEMATPIGQKTRQRIMAICTSHQISDQAFLLVDAMLQSGQMTNAIADVLISELLATSPRLDWQETEAPAGIHEHHGRVLKAVATEHGLAIYKTRMHGPGIPPVWTSILGDDLFRTAAYLSQATLIEPGMAAQISRYMRACLGCGASHDNEELIQTGIHPQCLFGLDQRSTMDAELTAMLNG